MKCKQIRSKKIKEREAIHPNNICPRCSAKLITIPLSPTQSCKMCNSCKWTNFGEE